MNKNHGFFFKPKVPIYKRKPMETIFSKSIFSHVLIRVSKLFSKINCCSLFSNLFQNDFQNQTLFSWKLFSYPFTKNKKFNSLWKLD